MFVDMLSFGAPNSFVSEAGHFANEETGSQRLCDLPKITELSK